MKGYFRTRRTVLVVVLAVLLEAGTLLAPRPMVVYHESEIVVFTPATPLQILVVGALSLGLSGRSEQFESVGVRRLPMLRLLNAGCLIAVGAVSSTAIALVLFAMRIDPGTVGVLAPLRSFLGLMGVALILAAFIDMRLGAICALPFVLLPGAFDMRPMPAGEALGFVLADAGTPVSWAAAIASAAVGLGLFSFAYSRRSSPSAERRALLDSRAKRHRIS